MRPSWLPQRASPPAPPPQRVARFPSRAHCRRPLPPWFPPGVTGRWRRHRQRLPERRMERGQAYSNTDTTIARRQMKDSNPDKREHTKTADSQGQKRQRDRHFPAEKRSTTLPRPGRQRGGGETSPQIDERPRHRTVVSYAPPTTASDGRARTMGDWRTEAPSSGVGVTVPERGASAERTGRPTPPGSVNLRNQRTKNIASCRTHPAVAVRHHRACILAQALKTAQT
jgi:hypothetical protein